MPRFQLIKRSTRNPTRLFCHRDVRTDAAVAGLSGASDIRTEASRDTSTDAWPSSAYSTNAGWTAMTFDPAALLVTILIPKADPPDADMSGKSIDPSGVFVIASVNAFVSDMISVTPARGI